MTIQFYVGLHHPHTAQYFEQACINWGALSRYKNPIKGNCKILLDSRAFSELFNHRFYRHTVEEHAAQIRHACSIADVEIAVAQDYMCEDFILERTALSVFDHQNMTITRYDELIAQDLPCPIMPVLQGYSAGEYVDHLRQYGDRLKPGMRVGVGSVCKRNADPMSVFMVLTAINHFRPDLKLHGFGLKVTALKVKEIRDMLFSADSAAWSYAARKQGRNQHDWNEAKAYENQIKAMQ